jgi:hypothetical protein
MEEDGMMHHAIYNRGGDDGVSEVIAEVLEVNVLCGVHGYAELTLCEPRIAVMLLLFYSA